MRLLITMIAVFALTLPGICLGNSERVCQELLLQGKIKAYWLRELLGHIPTSTWYGVILPFVVGIVIAFILWKISTFQRIFTFVHVLEHEITHGLTAIACGGRFMSMTVSLNGGVAQVSKSNMMINLAPYCLPLLCAIAFVLIGLMKPNMKMYGLAFAGILYGNYLRGAFSSLGIQTDIKMSGGKRLSYPIILTANTGIIFIIGFVLAKVHL